MRYIEYRVYLKDNIDEYQEAELLFAAIEDIKDALTDLISESDAPPIFTQDITYEIKNG